MSQTTRCRKLNKLPYFYSLKTAPLVFHVVETRFESKDDDLHPAILSGDFGMVVKLKSERNLTDNEKYVMLKRHFIPAASYKFSCRSV